MNKASILFGCILLTAELVIGQSHIFIPLFPIGERPNIGYKTNMRTSHESITFEANPTLRLSIINNIMRRFMNDSPGAYALYVGFRPQLRMYNDNSLPVKTPSYKISILGYQRIWRLSSGNADHIPLLAFSLESGHYSNGQSGCAFSEKFEDGSYQCDSIYRLIKPTSKLSDMLNRKSGNFSTNYSEVILNYRIVKKYDGDYRPLESFSFKGGIDIYHDKMLLLFNKGGYSDDDIKIYGKIRWIAGIEYMKKTDNPFFNQLGIDRYTVSGNLEQISNPHPSVTKHRVEVTGTLFFKNDVGIFFSWIGGHDNYNFRFLDSGTQFFAGITYDIFPRIQLK